MVRLGSTRKTRLNRRGVFVTWLSDKSKYLAMTVGMLLLERICLSVRIVFTSPSAITFKSEVSLCHVAKSIRRMILGRTVPARMAMIVSMLIISISEKAERSDGVMGGMECWSDGVLECCATLL